MAELVYTAIASGLAVWALITGRPLRAVLGFALAALALWGFAQLALDATVDRTYTWTAALRYSGYAATAVAGHAFLTPQVRERILRAAPACGLAIAAVSVLAYWTSPNRIFWTFTAPFPDVWGPFLSRNHFAQFLEIMLPIALWQALGGEGGGRGIGGNAKAAISMAWISAAVMLAAGLASASRAGAALLLAETFVILFRLARPRVALGFLTAGLGLASVAGGSTLLGRLPQADTMRPEIYRSTLSMIAEFPWTGYGVGTFAAVYPAYARFDAGVTVDRAHSDWLEWAAEGGIPLALVWALLLAASARPAWRSVWGLGILAVFIHAFVDYPFARSGIGAWTFLLMGALASENRPARPALH